MSQASGSPGPLDHFSALEDPRRQGWRVLYPLPEILLVVLRATLSGMEDFTEIVLWGQQRLGFLRRFLPYERGVPSHDTLGDVVGALDPELFKACFLAWVKGLRDQEPEIIAIDGKTSRRTHVRSRGVAPLHLVSAWASRQRAAGARPGGGGREIQRDRGHPLPLRRLQLRGALVTIDAMGNPVPDRQGHRRWRWRLPALAEGQPGPPSWPRSRPSSPIPPTWTPARSSTSPTPTTAAWSSASDRRFPDERPFPHLAAIAMVEATTERGGKTGHERRYYLCSARLDAKAFARAARAHWGVENRLHWVLDVVFHDDLARLRSGHGPQNMAIVKHMAMNLIRPPKDKHSLKNRRKLACLDDIYLDSLIRNQPTLT